MKLHVVLGVLLFNTQSLFDLFVCYWSQACLPCAMAAMPICLLVVFTRLFLAGQTM